MKHVLQPLNEEAAEAIVKHIDLLEAGMFLCPRHAFKAAL
jgi:hypothetical protein